jgi:drug/metabolite transporter (DMT)-like permease
MTKNIKGALLLLLASFIWGTAFVAQSVGMEYIGPFTFNGVRTLVGGLVLLPLIFVRSRSKQKRESTSDTGKEYIKDGIICGIILCIASSLQQVGLQYTTPGKAGFLTALYIVVVPLIGMFTNKKSNIILWVSVAIAVIGTFLISIKDDFTISRGDLLVIICALAYAAHIIAVDRFAPKVDAVKMSCVQFFTAGTISFIIALFIEDPSFNTVLISWGPILYAGIMSSGVAYTLQIIGQRDTNPTVASLIMSLESVFSVLSGWVILGDELTVRELTGCCLVFCAVIMAQLSVQMNKKKGILQ